jgi:hypothetical protein
MHHSRWWDSWSQPRYQSPKPASDVQFTSCAQRLLRFGEGGGGIHLVPNALRMFGSLDVEFHECRVDSIEIFSLHTGSQSGYWPYKDVGILSVSI